jgi:hypothetical protein
LRCAAIRTHSGGFFGRKSHLSGSGSLNAARGLRPDPPLSAAERISARDVVQAEIDAGGTFHIGKHTVLITATAG